VDADAEGSDPAHGSDERMTDVRVRLLLTLRHQRMPLPEIRALLSTHDQMIIRRHLELHRERLEERLAEEKQTLLAVESSLTKPIASGEPGVRSRHPHLRTARCFHP
jgi:DNA-binding transcriptional MerR regulator